VGMKGQEGLQGETAVGMPGGVLGPREPAATRRGLVETARQDALHGDGAAGGGGKGPRAPHDAQSPQPFPQVG